MNDDKLVIKSNKRSDYKTLIYPIYCDRDVQEHFLYREKMNELIDQWIEIEKQLKPIGVDEDFLLNKIAMLDLKTLAYMNNDDAEIEGRFTTIHNLLKEKTYTAIASRLVDLELQIGTYIARDIIEVTKGSIYSNLLTYSTFGYPTEREWFYFIHKYPHAWLLFLIKERLMLSNS